MSRIKSVVPLMLVASMSQATETVKIYNWTEYIAPDTLKQFQTQTGLHTQYDLFDTNEMLDSKLMVGRSGYDVVFPSSHFMGRQIKAGALKKLDKSKLPNWSNLNPQLLKALEVSDPGNQHGFPYLWGTTGIGYNVAKVKEVLGDDVPLDSWDLVLKPENMQKLSKCGVAILDSAPEVLAITLNYLGLPAHSLQASDYKKAEATLKEIRPYVRYFSSSKSVSDLANGEICLAVGFSGDFLQAGNRASEAKNGIEIAYLLPKEGSPMWFDMVAMPADAPDEKAGYAYMNYLLEPETMANITNYVSYANGNAKADALVSPELKANTKVYPTDEMISHLFAQQAMPKDIDRLRTRLWQTIKTGYAN